MAVAPGYNSERRGSLLTCDGVVLPFDIPRKESFALVLLWVSDSKVRLPELDSYWATLIPVRKRNRETRREKRRMGLRAASSIEEKDTTNV